MAQWRFHLFSLWIFRHCLSFSRKNIASISLNDRMKTEKKRVVHDWLGEYEDKDEADESEAYGYKS